MKKLIFITLTISGLLFFACKKKDTTPTDTSSGSGGGAGTTTGGSTTGGTPSSATQFSGILTCGLYGTATGTTVFSFPAARAYFSGQPVPYITPTYSVKVTNVYFNNDSLPFSIANGYYSSSGFVSLATENWSVSGANGIGTFTCASNLALPGWQSINLPDSISKSVGVNFNITNVANFKTANLIITDNLGGSGYYLQALTTGSNAINLTPANLSAIGTTTGGSLIVSLTNSKVLKFSGKDYQFNKEYQYFKTIKIKP